MCSFSFSFLIFGLAWRLLSNVISSSSHLHSLLRPLNPSLSLLDLAMVVCHPRNFNICCNLWFLKPKTHGRNSSSVSNHRPLLVRCSPVKTEVKRTHWCILISVYPVLIPLHVGNILLIIFLNAILGSIGFSGIVQEHGYSEALWQFVFQVERIQWLAKLWCMIIIKPSWIINSHVPLHVIWQSFDHGYFLTVRAIQELRDKKRGSVLVGIGGPSGSGKSRFVDFLKRTPILYL